MDDRYISDLAVKSEISASDYILIETEDGTKLSPASGLKKFMVSNMIVESLEMLNRSCIVQVYTCYSFNNLDE